MNLLRFGAFWHYGKCAFVAGDVACADKQPHMMWPSRLDGSGWTDGRMDGWTDGRMDGWTLRNQGS
jgi:hypothetical protein